MSTEADTRDNDLRERIRNFLRRNFPQIQMHGGSASIEEIDRDSGEVTIQLSGACSGCGISPMTVQAIKARMTKEIAEVTKVNASTGLTSGGHSRGGDIPGSDPDPGPDSDGPQAPF
ncbi:MAG: thioredoxin-like proteins and domain protein [halophilic archaeon J07HX5]|nr:MAG: thioredoxin-like proteins and domain protein [halophilic archaeon J07HX5]